MAFVAPEAKELLARIGNRLDSGCYPFVFNGGIVRPSTPVVEDQPQGTEHSDDQPTKQRGPATGSRQGSARGQGATSRSWSARRAAPLVNAGVKRQYEAEIDEIRSAYPGARIWVYDQGMWLLTESSVIDGLTRKATFLTAIPFVLGTRASAWGYWTTAVSASWIGPRHTNFPDGSVCAFEPRDGTWSIGQSAVKLLDLYTLWALRHLHLEIIGRWPGAQSVPIPYERLHELKDHELCGCDCSARRYADCCKPTDLKLDPRDTFEEFMRLTRGVREPPDWALPVIRGIQVPPSIPLPHVSHLLV